MLIERSNERKLVSVLKTFGTTCTPFEAQTNSVKLVNADNSFGIVVILFCLISIFLSFGNEQMQLGNSFKSLFATTSCVKFVNTLKESENFYLVN